MKVSDLQKLELFSWLAEFGADKLFGPLLPPITQSMRNKAWQTFFDRCVERKFEFVSTDGGLMRSWQRLRDVSFAGWLSRAKKSKNEHRGMNMRTDVSEVHKAILELNACRSLDDVGHCPFTYNAASPSELSSGNHHVEDDTPDNNASYDTKPIVIATTNGGTAIESTFPTKKRPPSDVLGDLGDTPDYAMTTAKRPKLGTTHEYEKQLRIYKMQLEVTKLEMDLGIDVTVHLQPPVIDYQL